MNIEKLIKKGKVSKVGDTYINVVFDDGTTGRLNFDDSKFNNLKSFSNTYERSKKNNDKSEFVLKRKVKEKSWMLSDEIERYRKDWEQIGNNIVGNIHAFEVDRYVSDSAVICHLLDDKCKKTVIEAFLHKEDIVGPTNQTIQDLLEIGDHLKAVVMRVSAEKHNLEISIKELRKHYQEKYEAYKQKRREIRKGKTAENKEKVLPHVTIPSELSIAIIEADERYTRSLKKLLVRLGVAEERVHELKTLESLETALKSRTFTHAILGYNFGGEGGFRQKAVGLLKKDPDLSVIVCSAERMDETLKEFVESNRFLFLPKPFGLDALVKFLNNELTYDPIVLANGRDRVKMWQSRSVLAERISGKIQKEMEKLASMDGVENVLLIEEISKGNYRIETALKELDTDTLRFERTLLNDMMENEIVLERKGDLGDFAKVMPQSVTYLLGHPVLYDPSERKALLVFAQKALKDKQKKSVEAAVKKILELIHQKKIEEQIEDDELFASLGRMSAGYMHELNNEVTILKQNMDEFRLFLSQCDETVSRQDLRKYERQLQSALNGLLRVNSLFLNTIQRERTEEIDIISTTRRIVRVFLANEPSLMVDFPYDDQQDWRLNIPPFPYEQALKNILLNAAFHTSMYKYGLIRIRMKMDSAKLIVTIEDNGRGMHTSTRQDLFRPRHSKKQGGKGMGLYLSKIMLESIGGDVRCIESYMYGGSTFEIVIPVTTEGVD